MLYGEPPFTSESAGELFALPGIADPPRLKERVPALADKVDELVHRLLGKQPATRPTMTEVAIELAGIPVPDLTMERPRIVPARHAVEPKPSPESRWEVRPTSFAHSLPGPPAIPSAARWSAVPRAHEAVCCP